jgi:hypothetical protein
MGWISMHHSQAYKAVILKEERLKDLKYIGKILRLAQDDK